MRHLTTHRLKLPFNGFEDIEGDFEDLLFAQEYVQAYTTFLNSKGIQVSLVFEELDSPQFYDNDTDKIFCKISEEDLLSLWNQTDKEELSRTIVDRFEQPTNINEVYPTKLSQGEWLKPVTEWDMTQLETLLQSILRQYEASLDCEDIIELMDLSKVSIPAEIKEQQNNG